MVTQMGERESVRQYDREVGMIQWMDAASTTDAPTCIAVRIESPFALVKPAKPGGHIGSDSVARR